MFDIGFTELLLVVVVGLFVIGPEHLPRAIRVVLLWANRFRRNFENLRADMQRELHNDEILQSLRESKAHIEEQTSEILDSTNQQKAKLEKVLNQGISKNLEELKNAETGSAEKIHTTKSGK